MNKKQNSRKYHNRLLRLTVNFTATGKRDDIQQSEKGPEKQVNRQTNKQTSKHNFIYMHKIYRTAIEKRYLIPRLWKGGVVIFFPTS